MKNVIIIAEGRQIVKVKGDAIMSVDGNMLYEVNGDMQHVVRGNYELSVGGQLNLNASEEIQARAAKIRLEANVEGINIKAGKNISMQSGEAFNIKSGIGINQQAVGDINIKGDNLFVQGAGDTHIKSDQVFVEAVGDLNVKGDNLFVQGTADTHIKSDQVFVEAAGNMNIKGDDLFVQGTGNTNIKSAQVFLDATGNMNIKAAYTKIGNGQISLKGTSVAIDEYVYLANGQAVTAPGGTAAAAAEAATAAEEALTTPPAESADLPEPASKSSGNGGGGDYIGGGYRNPSAGGGGGYISVDDYIAGETLGVGAGSSTGNLAEPLSSSYTQGALRPLLDLLGQAEGAGYDTIVGYVNRSDYPPKPLTALTVDEVLAWQDSIDSKYNSEAAGRYQVMEDTLRGLRTRGIVIGTSLYNAKTQDDIAIALLKGRGLNRFLDGSITAEQFGNSLAQEWASFPIMDGPRRGQGYYARQGGKLTPETVLSVLKSVKDFKATSGSTSSNVQ